MLIFSVVRSIVLGSLIVLGQLALPVHAHATADDETTRLPRWLDAQGEISCDFRIYCVQEVKKSQKFRRTSQVMDQFPGVHTSFSSVLINSHDVVLGGGSVPLPLLRREVSDWISAQEI